MNKIITTIEQDRRKKKGKIKLSEHVIAKETGHSSYLVLSTGRIHPYNELKISSV